MKKNFQHSAITSQIINAYYNVYNILGYGFLEKVYLKSLLIELRKLGLRCSPQEFIKVITKGLKLVFTLLILS
jgi:GxxExxY protein